MPPLFTSHFWGGVHILNSQRHDRKLRSGFGKSFPVATRDQERIEHIQIFGQEYLPGLLANGGQAVHGSITVRPHPANPPLSRVAMLAPAASAVAAINASNFSIGLPA
jgi:hypothetical protein